jgi:CRISPR-associated protein Cmr2
MTDSFVPYIAHCIVSQQNIDPQKVAKLVEKIFKTEEGDFQSSDDLFALKQKKEPSLTELLALQQEIEETLEGSADRIDLVYGGVTKVKGYVFEAPHLQEIRGASSLLDWINTEKLREIWQDICGAPGKEGIVYASGGNILAFAPAGKGATFAQAIECAYTCHTLHANSVAVWDSFSLLELRYGRLRRKADGAFYWVDDFRKDWQDPEKRELLKLYYYLPDEAGIAPDDESEATARLRFYHRKTFGELVKWLSEKFYRRRQSYAADGNPRAIPLSSLHPYAVKCPTSGIRSAVVNADVPAPTQRSEASAIKLYIGQQMKRGAKKNNDWFYNQFKTKPEMVGDLKPARRFDPSDDSAVAKTWEQLFLKYLHKNQKKQDCKGEQQYYQEWQRLKKKNFCVYPAQDMGEIGQASSPQRYIGLIYADGNNVGRLVERIPTPAQYREKSVKLEQAARTAVFHALAKHLRPTEVRNDQGNNIYIHPFEIITIGGDDLLLIVPGSVALDIALTIGYEFERLMVDTDKQRSDAGNPARRFTDAAPQGVYDFFALDPQVSLSAGVVIAQENAPIFFLRDLVEELLKSAKKKAKKDVTGGQGTVDFMVMKSITMVSENIEAFRAQALHSSDNIHLTARPYTWAELQVLLLTARALREISFPRSQLYLIQQRLFDAQQNGSLIMSVIDYLYARTSGVRNPQARDLLAKAFDFAWHDPRQDIVPWKKLVAEVRINEPEDVPFHKKKTVPIISHETIWPDLVEIYDFVSGTPVFEGSETSDEAVSSETA